MDNYRKYNSRKSRPSAVDGFLGGGPGSRTPNHKTPQQSSQPQARQVGNFKSTDGFHPIKQGTVITSARPAAPIRTVGRQPKRDHLGNIKLDLPDLPDRKRKRKSQGRSRRKLVFKGFAGLIIVGVLITGFILGKAYLKAGQIFRGGGGAAALEDNVDPAKLKGEGDGRVNILLLGKGGAGHEAPDLTDTILVASFDPIQKEAALLSIPRDLYVRSSAGYTKINAVYANAKYSVLNGKRIDDQQQRAEDAGLAAITKTVEDHMGIPVHYHVIIDFEGFKKAIDEVGGIDINVKEPLYETMSINGKRYVLDVKAGREHFDGFRALAYSRSRMVSPRGDFDRTERQRLVLLALKDKVLSAGTFANPKKVSGLIDAFGNNMRSNLSVSEIMRIYELGKDIDGSKIASIGLADPPNSYVQTANIGGLSVVVPKAGVDDYSEIRSFVRNALKDGFLRNEDATIAVYNGTNIPGLAGKRAADLKSYGYNISAIADAPTKTYTKSVLVDLRGGNKKYTKRYLEQRLGVTAVNSMPDSSINPNNADFVIILGTDAGNSY
jgi:polyisoprenyl-teichoic acid--peptidoglycan teichoic acid transferase